MKKNCATAFLLLLFLVVFISASCSKEQDKNVRRLAMALPQDPTSLDPAMIVDVTGGSVAAKLYNGLVRFDERMSVAPDIASGWDISDAGTTYIFTLRRDIFFHNGRRLTAHDVKYSFERVLSPDSGSRRKWLFDPIRGARTFMEGDAGEVSGLQVVDDYTIRIELDRPLAVFLQFLAMPNAYVVPREEVERWGNDFSDHAAGTGPFILKEWRHDERLTLARNDAYYAEHARVDEMEYRVIPEDFTRVAEFEAGNLDILEIPAAEYARISADRARQKQMKVRGGLNTYYLGFNCQKPPMNDASFRRALSQAIDRQKIVEVILQGRAQVAGGPIPPELPGHSHRDSALKYDPVTARAELSSERRPQRPLKLYQSADQRTLEVAEAIQYYLRRAGVDVEIVQLEWTAYKQAVNDGLADMFLLSWYADYPDAENFLYPVFHSSNWGASGNRSFYRNPVFDSLIERAQREPDERKRAALYAQAETVVIDEAPWVFLWHRTDHFLAQPWVKGFEPAAIPHADKGTGVEVAGAEDNNGRPGLAGLLFLAPIAGIFAFGIGYPLVRPSLLPYAARRLLIAVPTLIGVALIVFMILKMAPGDPALALVGERADPQTIEQLRRELRLDDPLAAQFANYLRLICKGELGRSYYTKRPVARSLMEKFPNTLRLAGAAITISILFGVTLGVVSALKHNTVTDKLLGMISVAGISTPVFWLALLLVFVFAYTLNWLPPSGMGRGELAYLVLPAIALGTNSAAFIARVTRSSMLEILSQPFITTARAKGLTPLTAAIKHALRNALIPITTLIGIDMGSYLNGSVLTETIFGWDGIGRYAMTGILKHDYPVILGTVLFGAAVFVAVNLLVDLLYAAIDPRIELQKEK